MSGWVVASIVGGVFGVAIVVALVYVSRAVMRTAENASQLMGAMEEVQRRTRVLVDLESFSRDAGRMAERTTSALDELYRRQAQSNGGQPAPKAPPPGNGPPRPTRRRRPEEGT